MIHQLLNAGAIILVSAGFSPAAIGEETDGSIIMPCNRAALYSIKPTPGLISNKGLVPVSNLFDVPGPMAKTAEDRGILMDALVGMPNDKEPNKYPSASRNGSWRDLRIGVLDPESWQQPAFMVKHDASATKQMIKEIMTAYGTIRPLAKAFHENIELHFPTTEDRTALPTLHNKQHGFKRDFESYLSNLEYSKVRTLEQLVQFNKARTGQELRKGNFLLILPGKDNQYILEECLNFTPGAEEYSETMKHVRSAGRSQGIDQALDRYELDVIIGPADSSITKMPSFASS
ncbi:hypothetical protein N0V90_012061 [Kalmusia sp. IMI 367209]|nr:hypothetical protein N0V90_012061 [Kalmusia sp. IMI 367209]